MIHIAEIMTSLAATRPVFHSEADFQHAFAWELHKLMPEAQVRLEMPVLARLRLDLWVVQGKQCVAIELKYKTRGLNAIFGDEHFALRSQGAQDLGRYDFIKDLCRLERIVKDRARVTGYAILLTNDSAYWKGPSSSDAGYVQFSLEDNRTLHGTLTWGQNLSVGTTRKRESGLSITGSHRLQWMDYSEVAASSYGSLRYLVARVARGDDEV